MINLDEALATALRHHQAGRLQEAEPVYQQILKADPNHVDALNLLGVLALQRGDSERAIECIAGAIRRDGSQAPFHNNLGNALRSRGQLAAAIDSYQRALQLRPNYPEAHNNLGIALAEQGQFPGAIAAYQRALELRPNNAAAHNNLGVALRFQGQLAGAIASYQRAVQLRPDYAEAHNNLGNALRAQGELAPAIASYQRALQLRPNYADAHNNLGIALGEQGQLAPAIASYQPAFQLGPNHAEAHNNRGIALWSQGELAGAIAAYQRALQLRPDYADAHNNLGIALAEQGEHALAVASFQRALQLRPDYAEAYKNLGLALEEQGELAAAVVSYQRALEVRPDYAEGHIGLGTTLLAQGDCEGALATFVRALALKPDHAGAHSSALFCRQYRPGVTCGALAQAHAAWNERHAAPLRAARAPHDNDRDPLRRLRLGFLSPDFRRHPVGYFLIQALEKLDRDQCEIVCYRDRFINDDLSLRFQAAATVWRDVGGLSDTALAEMLRDDRIDILFDLAGHSAHNRLLVFARKPAPIQITWIGYEGTTGLETIDFILADRYTIPPGQEAWYREQVLRMPEGYVCYDPPEPSPAVAPLAALRNGYIRFGSFNNLAKISPEVVAVWAKVLGRVRDSRLRLKYKGLGDALVRGRYLDLFATCGVDPSRVELTPPSGHAEYLAGYGEIDIALDPFPFGGGITTCDALWMGVPVITCPGETFASRHSLSHLWNAGLRETIAASTEEYVELAVSLAGDLPGLARLRAGLRPRLAASPLCDGERFAGNLMQVLRGAWRQWCQEEPAP
jgi:predicted O-linked N-acetylglucosamine transferase (SPINDLY family)